MRSVVALLVSGFVALGLLAVEDKKTEAKAPEGVWGKEVDDFELTLDFTKKDAVTITVMNGDNGLVINCKLSPTKEGGWKAKATKIEVKGDFPVQLADDYECGFKFEIDGDKAKLSDFTASEGEDQGKEIVEGEYKKVKKDK
jgi:hypothetical protein